MCQLTSWFCQTHYDVSIFRFEGKADAIWILPIESTNDVILRNCVNLKMPRRWKWRVHCSVTCSSPYQERFCSYRGGLWAPPPGTRRQKKPGLNRVNIYLRAACQWSLRDMQKWKSTLRYNGGGGGCNTAFSFTIFRFWNLLEDSIT